jgi:hypothetical protein
VASRHREAGEIAESSDREMATSERASGGDTAERDNALMRRFPEMDSVLAHAL